MFVLCGEGIQCEKESLHFFHHPELESSAQLLLVQDLLQNPEASLKNSSSGDLVVFPGGFSFADHFGSGKLLSFKLSEKNIFKMLIDRGLHLIGTCNGFQVLTEARIFGEGVRLEHNRFANRDLGFVNRWVDLKTADPLREFKVRIPVRHGEGRLLRDSSQWNKNVRPFLFYDDAFFDNGSVDRVAGLWCREGRSQIVGLMPHPEIALRSSDEPDGSGLQAGGGLILMKEIFKTLGQEG